MIWRVWWWRAGWRGRGRVIACGMESTGLVQQGQNRYRRQVPETPGLAVVGMCFGGWMAL
jgi:hypothetical protein